MTLSWRLCYTSRMTKWPESYHFPFIQEMPFMRRQKMNGDCDATIYQNRFKHNINSGRKNEGVY